MLPFPNLLRVALRVWGNVLVWIERWIGGIKLVVIGREHIPPGACIIAAKHQSEWETFKLQYLFDNPAVVLKEELTRVPLLGWYAKATGMIPIDRGGRNKTLNLMMRAAHAADDAGRKIVIFPQGTRIAPLDKKPYKVGVAALYQELNLPLVPMALNSGLIWPRRSFIKHSGTITIEFLPAIPAGLPRTEMMQQLETQLEAASDRLASLAGNAS